MHSIPEFRLVFALLTRSFLSINVISSRMIRIHENKFLEEVRLHDLVEYLADHCCLLLYRVNLPFQVSEIV